jgi:hypothetical protein
LVVNACSLNKLTNLVVLAVSQMQSRLQRRVSQSDWLARELTYLGTDMAERGGQEAVEPW